MNFDDLISSLKQHSPFLLASVTAHWLVILTFNHFVLLKQTVGATSTLRDNMIKVETISKEKLKNLVKLRSVGTKDGVKTNEFSLPFHKRQNKIVPNKKITLKALNIGPTLPKLSKKIASNNKKAVLSLNGKKHIRSSPSRNAIYAISKKNLGGELRPDIKRMLEIAKKNERAVIDVGSLGLQFEAPKGIALDELNRLEQIFYSFNKRAYESYIASILTGHSKFLSKFPNFQNQYKVYTEELRGRITFSRTGDIKSIKFLQGSQNDKIQNLFEEILTSMQSLPNPPKAYVKNGEFNVYYKLLIKGSYTHHL